MRGLSRGIVADLIHAGLVAFITIAATAYAIFNKDRSANIWIVYGSAIAFAAGRAGASIASHMVGARRVDDLRHQEIE